MRRKLIRFHLGIRGIAVILLMLSSTFANAKQDQIAIFTATKVFTSLSSGKAKMLFKGRIKRLNNKKIVLLDWPNGSKMKKQFYHELLGQSEARINAYRAKLVFSGKGVPPKIVQQNNYLAVEKYIKGRPNSIGYALKSMISKEFTILYVVPAGENL
ncbi:MAG: hypothetical protein KAH18_07695 [Psychromonas sp.]|nr:hypothetical protein [Psychromonas sp.]